MLRGHDHYAWICQIEDELILRVTLATLTLQRFKVSPMLRLPEHFPLFLLSYFYRLLLGLVWPFQQLPAKSVFSLALISLVQL